MNRHTAGLLIGILFFFGVQNSYALTAVTLTEANSNTVVDVAQGTWLVITAPTDITAVEYHSELYLRNNLSKNHDFALPVGLRQKQGVYRLDFFSSPTSATGKNLSLQVQVIHPSWPEQHLTLQSTKHVDLSPKDLARVQKETPKILASFTPRSVLSEPLVFASPLLADQQGTRFGARRIINKKPRKRHTGADYAAPKGQPLYSSARGTILLAEEHFFAGNSVFIDHGDGLVSMYFHLETMQVTAGEMVPAGKQIGTVGSTGRATGPHLHFGIRYRNLIVDPDETVRIFSQHYKKKD